MPIAGMLVELYPFKTYVFDDYPFSLPRNWGKHMDFNKFVLTSKAKILETTSF